MPRTISVPFGIAAALVVLPLLPLSSSAAQFPPDSLVNLQYFPKDTPVRQLIGNMRQFTFALGVRCQYCHVGEEGQPLSEFDFPSDEKRTKRTARIMLRMVEAINGSHLTNIPGRREPNVEVSCTTCHRGLSRPRMLAHVLAETLSEEGLDATIDQYRELREEYYGSGSYDFSEMVLSEFAETLVQQGSLDDALGILSLNGEMFPESVGVPFAAGNVLVAKGDTTAAIRMYETAIEKAPHLRTRIQARIDQLKSQ